MGPEHTLSPTYRRAAVTSTPRNVAMTDPPALHPRVTQLQRQGSGSSQNSGTSQNPLLGTGGGTPTSSNKSAGSLELPATLEKRRWRRVST